MSGTFVVLGRGEVGAFCVFEDCIGVRGSELCIVVSYGSILWCAPTSCRMW